MKKVLYTTALVLFVSAAPAWATKPQATSTPAGLEKANSIAPRETAPAKNEKPKNNTGKSAKSKGEQKEKNPPATASATPVASSTSAAATDAPQPASLKTAAAVANDPATRSAGTNSESSKPASTTGAAPATSSAPAASLTNIYRVGIGDVLDIRLLNAQSRSSTLYTVLPGGLLEYPLAGDPLNVVGMTTDEIAERLRSLIKIYEKPQVTVNVREYQSHSVIVTGLVNDPGLKYLRRESVPLYVVMTESQPRAEAARAVIMRQGNQNLSVDLSDTNALSTLVLPGDVIKLTAALPQFYFVGGAVSDPGQKSFHTGLTLTQAILAAGGTTRFAASEVKVSRQGADGRLVMTKYNLKKIEEGKVPDPTLQPGDRIEVTRAGW